MAIAARFSQSCAVLTNGSVFCWGNNFGGQLGTGSGDQHSDLPAEVQGLEAGVDLRCGLCEACNNYLELVLSKIRLSIRLYF